MTSDRRLPISLEFTIRNLLNSYVSMAIHLCRSVSSLMEPIHFGGTRCPRTGSSRGSGRSLGSRRNTRPSRPAHGPQLAPEDVFLWMKNALGSPTVHRLLEGYLGNGTPNANHLAVRKLLTSGEKIRIKGISKGIRSLPIAAYWWDTLDCQSSGR